MKPSDTNHELFILDQRPELELLRDAINDPTTFYDERRSLQGEERYINFARRFRVQTLIEPLSPESGWKEDAEFRVRPEDELFVMKSITKAFARRSTLRKLGFMIGPKHKAARDILGAIGGHYSS
jgi:hypothetical protein